MQPLVAWVILSKLRKNRSRIYSSWQLIEEKKVARLRGRVDDYKYLTKQCKLQLRKYSQRWADVMVELGEMVLETGQVKDAFANFRRL